MLKPCNSDSNLNRNPNFQSRLIRWIGAVLSNGTCFQNIWFNKKRSQMSSEISIGCQWNGQWAATNHLSGSGLVQPFNELPSAAWRCAKRGCALINQLANMSHNKIAVRFRDAQFCECSVGLYLLTEVRSHALIVALGFSATLLNYSFALQPCSVHVAKC